MDAPTHTSEHGFGAYRPEVPTQYSLTDKMQEDIELCTKVHLEPPNSSQDCQQDITKAAQSKSPSKEQILPKFKGNSNP